MIIGSEHTDFLDSCCEALGIELHELLGKAKSASVIHVVRARKAIAWAARERFPELTYPRLGKLLKRDHSTIMYSVNRFASALKSGEPWATQLAGRIPGRSEALAELESPLDSLRRCAAIDLSNAVEMPIESLIAMGAAAE